MSSDLYENLHELIQGVIVISGLPGTGKTTAAMTIAVRVKQVVLDFDLKDDRAVNLLASLLSSFIRQFVKCHRL